MSLFRVLRPKPGDEGTTLAETMVSILIFAMLGAALAATLVSTQRTYTASNVRGMDLDGGRLALEAMVKHVRTADAPASAAIGASAFCSATPTSIVFFADDALQNPTAVNPSPTSALFSYAVVGGNLVEQSVPVQVGVTPTCATPFVTSRILAKGVTNSTVFTFFPVNSAATGLPGAQLVPAGALSAAQLPLVANISISLTVRLTSNPTIPGTTVTSAVRLTNSN